MSDLISLWKPEPDLVTHQALGKSLEECGELSKILARCLIQGVNEVEPITIALNKQELLKEIADVYAATTWLLEVLDDKLDEERVKRKLEGFRRWDKMLTE